jgi:competence protein ComEC
MYINFGLRYLVGIISELPYAAIHTPIPDLWQILFFYILILLLFNASVKKTLLLPLSIVVYFFVLFILNRSDQDYLEVAFLDVGQGDASFLKFPNGNTMLIDGGATSFQWDQGSKTIIPFLKKRGILHLDYVIGSHGHNDHIGGLLSVIENITVDTLVLNDYKYNSKLYRNLINKAKSNKIPIKTVKIGDQLYPDPMCRVYVLHPDTAHIRAETFSGAECNNSSIVLKVQYGKNGILFTGDLEKSAENPVLRYQHFLESEILKVGHHGSSTSSSLAFISFVNPILAVISVAQKNKFGHPSPSTLIRLKKAGITTQQTNHKGALLFHITPDQITRIAWR